MNILFPFKRNSLEGVCDQTPTSYGIRLKGSASDPPLTLCAT